MIQEMESGSLEKYALEIALLVYDLARAIWGG